MYPALHRGSVLGYPDAAPTALDFACCDANNEITPEQPVAKLAVCELSLLMSLVVVLPLGHFTRLLGFLLLALLLFAGQRSVQVQHSLR